MRFLFLFFVVVPLTELYLLLWVSRQIGFGPTLAITIVTGFIGASLAKREGLRAWREWNLALSRFEAPATGLTEAVLIVVGGAFLLTPGIITDAFGLLVLVPPTRRVIAAAILAMLRRRFEGRVADGRSVSHRASGLHRDAVPHSRASGGHRVVVETTGENLDDQP